MGVNDKVAATFHPEEPIVIDANSLADWLCEQFEVMTESGGNGLQGVHVVDVTMGGRIVTVDWANGQRFRIEVQETMTHVH